MNEASEDAISRRAGEAADAELKKMTYVLFCFALLIVGVVFVDCVYSFATGDFSIFKVVNIFIKR